MRLKISALPLFLLALSLTPRVSFADTVTLKLDSANSSPYVFTIGGTTVDLSCLNDNRTVHDGESWTATVVNLGDLISNPSDHSYTDIGGITLGQLEADAYLDYQYTASTPYTSTEIQDAIWTILDGTLTTGDYSTDMNNSGKVNDLKTYVYTGLSGGISGTQDQAVQSLVSAAQTTSESASFYTDFNYYYPTGNGWNLPQQFLGYQPPAATPEPSSLLLMGTGIIGAAFLLRRRMVNLG